MLEPPVGTSEACIEENDQYFTRDAAVAMHSHSDLFREPRRHVVCVHIAELTPGLKPPRGPFMSAVHCDCSS